MTEDPPLYAEMRRSRHSRAVHGRPGGGRHQWRTEPDPATGPIPRGDAVTQPEHVQTGTPHLKIGRLAEHDETEHPRLKLGSFLRSSYKGTVPDVVDYSTRVASWPVALNDQLGCCTAADYAHGIQVWTTWGQGQTATPTDDDVLAFYSGSTGYRPGHPETDQGGNMQEVCAYARKTGMAGRRIEAFFQVDVDDPDELRAALYLFGAVSIGMAFPKSAEAQFEAGQPWDTVRNDGGDQGGHDVLLVKMTRGGNYVVVTWGRLQEVTPRFWAKYMTRRVGGEAWARVEQDWASRTGVAPGNALTVDQLNAAFTQLTGQPGPFTGGTPSPAPKPPPGPVSPSAPPSDPAAFLRWLRDLLNQLFGGR